MKNAFILFACLAAFIGMVTGKIQTVIPFASVESEIVVAGQLLGTAVIFIWYGFDDFVSMIKKMYNKIQ